MVKERENPFRVSRARYSELIHLRRYEIVRSYVRGRVLDIACGDGYGAALLYRPGKVRYVGMDIDIESVKTAKLAYRCFGEYAVADASSALPFSNERFDTVCSLETIEHLERVQQAKFYSELLRVLKSHGVLIISTPNRDWKTKKALRESGWNNPYHKYEFNTAEFEDFLCSSATYPVEIRKKHYLGFAYNLTGIIYPNILTYRAGKWMSRSLLQIIDRLDLALGVLIPRYSNSLCFVIQKF